MSPVPASAKALARVLLLLGVLGVLAPPAPAADSATLAAAEKLLADSDPAERVKALAMLDEMGRSAAAEKLAAKSLRDADWGVQIRACKTLGKVAQKSAVESLANLAVEGDIQWVRDAAAEALREIDAGEGCDAVLGVAARMTRDENLRARALDSAGKIAAARHAERLSGYARSKEVVVAAASVRAVGRLGNDAAAQKQVLDTLDGALDRRADKKYFLAYAAAVEGLGRVQHSLSHFFLQEEGMQQASDPRARMIFAADNLGLSLEQIRQIAREGGFEGQLNEETMKKIAPDYSMFRLIVNVVREKSEWVENL